MRIEGIKMILDNIELLRTLKNYDTKSNEFLDSIPKEISDAFFDNSHVTNLSFMVDALIKAHFKDYAEEVFWFLYEWDGIKPTSVFDFDGKEFIVKSIDEYIEFLKTCYKDR